MNVRKSKKNLFSKKFRFHEINEVCDQNKKKRNEKKTTNLSAI